MSVVSKPPNALADPDTCELRESRQERYEDADGPSGSPCGLETEAGSGRLWLQVGSSGGAVPSSCKGHEGRLR